MLESLRTVLRELPAPINQSLLNCLFGRSKFRIQGGTGPYHKLQ
jgi:hypothetical protein